MKTITLKELQIENFKGISKLSVPFWNVTNIRGENAAGKTTVCDAFFWLLFNKDSTGSEKFSIRPLGADGKQIDNVEISVKGTLDVDGKEVQLSKTQKQKWVKKRGSDTATLQGNENVYEIDGFPASEKEYQEKINSIVSESLFKMVTNPKAFASLKWQDQRKVLMGFVSDITDATVIDADPEKFSPIADEVLTAGIEKALEKAKNLQKKLKEKQKEYPARIDEASKAIIETGDVAELELQKSDLERKLRDVRKEIDGSADSFKAAADLQAEIMQKRRYISEIELQEAQKITKALDDARKAHEEASRKSNDLFFKRKRLEESIKSEEQILASLEDRLAEVKRNYTAVRDEVMPEDSLICPTCGQKFPDDRISTIRSDYESNKSKRRADIIAEGDKINEKIIETRKHISDGNSECDALKEEWNAAAATEGQAYEFMNSLPKEADMDAVPEYKQAQADLQAMTDQFKKMDTGDSIKTALRAQENQIQEELAAINRTFAAIDANIRAEERIAALREEQLTVGQQVADQEMKVCLLEDLSRTKMEMLSGKINEQFEIVNFKLFENLINGGYKDTCEMTIDGVPYSSLNSAGKIQGGLDVIKALSRLYDVSAPIIIDNRESTITIPQMDAQIINLYVDERYKKLEIEQG